MDLRICFQEGGKKELIRAKGMYYIQGNGGELKKLSERDALREYLDPKSFGQISRPPHEIFPNAVHLIDMKWTEKESLLKYSAAGIKFNVDVKFGETERVNISIVEGKLWQRPKKGIKY